jgi:hypothetical protein
VDSTEQKGVGQADVDKGKDTANINKEQEDPDSQNEEKKDTAKEKKEENKSDSKKKEDIVPADPVHGKEGDQPLAADKKEEQNPNIEKKDENVPGVPALENGGDQPPPPLVAGQDTAQSTGQEINKQDTTLKDNWNLQLHENNNNCYLLKGEDPLSNPENIINGQVRFNGTQYSLMTHSFHLHRCSSTTTLRLFHLACPNLTNLTN